MSIQKRPPKLAARLVLVMATAALTLAAKVDPPLNLMGMLLSAEDLCNATKRKPLNHPIHPTVRETIENEKRSACGSEVTKKGQPAHPRNGISLADKAKLTPKEDGALNNVGHIVRLEGENVRAETATFAEEDRVDEAGHSGADLDRSTAGIVEHTCRPR